MRQFRHLLGFCAGSLREARLRNECSLSPCAAERVNTTIAYQGSGRGFDLGVLQQLEAWVQKTPNGLRQPDVTVWFELDPAIAAVRLAGARVPDRFEAQPMEFFQKVSDGYAARAQADAQRFVRLDAAQTRDAVWQQLHLNFVQRGWLSAN